MMGKDIEAIVSGIDAVKKATVSAIQQVATGSAYQLKCKEQHGGISTGECLPKEEPVPLGDIVAPKCCFRSNVWIMWKNEIYGFIIIYWSI